VTATLPVEAPTTQAGVPRSRRWDWPSLAALVLGALGVGYRVLLLANHLPLSNSDEATMGLAALHIAQGTDFPTWYYGQHYMGTPEAYAASPLVWAFGPSVVALRIPTLLCYAIFLWCAYKLTRVLYRPWLAVLTVGLLALGSDRVIRDQLIAGGGYPEVLPLGAGTLLLALLLGLDRLRRPWLGYAGFGLLVGFVFWDDWLILPYTAVALVVLVVGCGRRLLGWPPLLMLAGAVVGGLPALIYNIRFPDDNSYLVYKKLSEGVSPVPLGGRIRGGIGIGVALANGGCQPGHCGGAEVVGSYLYVGLLVVAVILAGLALAGVARRALVPPLDPGDGVTVPAQPGASRRRLSGTDRTRLVAQLGLGVAALVTVVMYVRNPGSSLVPLETARYLAPMQISLAAALWPLWLLARRLPGAAWWRGARRPGLGSAVLSGVVTATLAVLCVAMLSATVGNARQVPRTRADQRNLTTLAATLQRLGINRVYSEYWTCNRLAYATGEKLICAAFGEDLRRAQDRLPEYRQLVLEASRIAYVTPTVGPNWRVDVAFQRHLDEIGVTPSVTELPGYRIYQVTGNIGVPAN
jgi:hypothetical protein